MADQTAASSGPSPSRLGTVRWRTTLGAVAVVGVALAVASIALVVLLRSTLTHAVEAVARVQATDVAEQLPSSPETSLNVLDAEEQLIQVVDPTGRVVASSSNVAGMAPVADLTAGGSIVTHLDLDDGADFVVVAETAEVDDGSLLVLVGRSLEDVAESTGAVTRLVVIGAPLLLAVVALTTWWVVGRALAPVEAIRSQVDAISSTALDRRVPELSRGDEISRLAQTMNRMLDRLESSQLRQRRFVSDASHELRSPVATIRQIAEVAAAYPELNSIEEVTAAVLAEDLRIQALLDDLLMLARSDEGSPPTATKPIDVDYLLRQAAQRIRMTSGILVDTSAVVTGRVEGDPVLLARMVSNLADNAARHARSQVVFGLAEQDAFVIITVDDDGPGIAPADRERVFERFVRLDEARSRAEGGTGLGLAIVSEVVAAHAGTVSITDAPSGGARFTVQLPRSLD